jgi:hypothetical protein
MAEKRNDVEHGYTYRIKVANIDSDSPYVLVWCYDGEYENMGLLSRLFRRSKCYNLQGQVSEEIERTIEKAKRGARSKWENEKQVKEVMES